MPTSLNASLNVQLNSASLNASSKQIQQALGRITGQSSEFQKSLDASTARVFAFGATTAVLNGVTQSFKKLVATTVEVQKQLIEINSIFQATESSFNKFRNAIFQVAKETGQSFSTVAEGAAELARQGLSAAETAERLKASLVLTRISGMDAEKSVKALTAAINGFTSASLTANQIVNKMVAVDTAFAVSTQDLAEAFSRAGSTAEDAGVSFDQLLGLVTAVEQKTARGGAVIGNAFKSIFTRLSRGSTIESLKELGVSIDATQSGIQKLQALSNALENISDPTIASEIKELAGGVFQINVVSAALKDLGSDTSTFKNAAVTAATATNEAFEKNKALGESIAHQMNALVIGLTSLAEKIGTITFGPLLENLLGVATKFTDFLDKALDPEKGNIFIKGFFKAIGSFLGGPAIILVTAAFAKIVKLVAKFAIGGLKSLFAMGTQAEKIKQIEGGIVGLLGRDAALRQTITSTTASQAQKEQAIIKAIQTENALLQQQAVLMRSLASAAAARGVTGFGSSGFTGRRGRAFAGGYQQEEAMATMLGAKNPKAHKGKGTIGGRSFTMNNRETEIPRFGRNGDSAVIPHYAGGFVPNYALPSVAAINKGQRSKFLRKDGTFRSDWMNTEVANKTGRGTALLAQKNKKGARRLPLSGAGKAMLVPRLNYERMLPSGFTGSFTKGKKTYKYSLSSGLNIRGPKIPRSIDDISDPQDEQLRPNIAKAVTREAAKFAKTLYPVTGRGVSQSKITRQLLKQGGGKGALHAIIGAAFEAAVMAGLNLSPAKRTEGGDFDVRESTTNNLADIQALFFGKGKNKTTKLMDFKASASANSGIPSFAKKIFNEQYKGGKTVPAGYAGGFIPNFAGGLGAAIEREEAAGIPVSKIRAHFDKRGMPKAVTNTGDEPKGLASLGFVPNYAKFDTGNIMMGLFALQGVFATFAEKQQETINQAAKEVEARERNVDILEVGLAQWASQKKANEERLTQTKQETDVMSKLMAAASAASTALLTLTTLNALTGGAAGRQLGAGMGAGMSAVSSGHASGRWFGAEKRQAKADAAKKLATERRVRYKAELKKGPALDHRGKPMSLADQKTRARIHAGYRGKDLELDSAKRRASKAPSKIGKVGKFAGKAGIVAALAFGAYDIGSTVLNKDINEEQKTERVGRKGSALAGGLAGAAIGQALIPVPLVGALIGGAVGAIAGGEGGKALFGGDADENAEKKRKESEKQGLKVAQKEGLIGFDQATFESRANENLQKIAAGGGDANAVAQRYTDALKNRADLWTKEDQGIEQSLEDHKAAQEEVVQAAMMLADTNFRDADNRKENDKKLLKAENKLWWSKIKLADAYTILKNKTIDTVKRAKDEERESSLKVGLKDSIRGPMAKAVGVASEQDLMMKQINTARAEKSKADADLAAAVAGGKMDEAGIDELRKAAKKAGDDFRGATNKAGTNFLNTIKKTEDLIEANKKKRIELDRSFFKSSMDIVGGLLSGKRGGDVKSIGVLLTSFSKRLETMKRDRRMRTKQGYEDKFTKGELVEQGQFWEEFKTAIKSNLGEGADPLLFLEKSEEFKGILATFKDPKNQRAQRDAYIDYGTEHDFDKKTRAGLQKGTQAIFAEEGATNEEAVKELTREQRELAAIIATTKKNYNDLLTKEDTKEHATNLRRLQAGMAGAAESYENVKKYVLAMSKETDATQTVIAENANFVLSQKQLISSLTAEVEELQEAVYRLGNMGD